MKINPTISLLVFAAPLAISCNVPLKTEDQPERPNFIFLFADDQDFLAIGAAGNQVVKTPNIDLLASQGTMFSHCFTQGSWTPAVCIASRAMLITGKFIYHAQRDVNRAKLWTEAFSDSGYLTFLTGKWHNNDRNALRSFDIIRGMTPGMYETKGGVGGPGYYRPTPENNTWSPHDRSLLGHWSPEVKDMVASGGDKSFGEPYRVEQHTSELLADNAVEFLENHAKDSDQPFFMYVAFNAPHDPRQSPKEFVDMYDPSLIPLPANYLPEHPFDQGDRYTLRDEILAPFPRTPGVVRTHIHEYYAIITHMDREIGRILEALDKTGLSDNTYIIFTSDHGLAVGQHGLMGKQNQYDHSIRVPFVISGPGIPGGRVSDEMVYLYNLYATTCELAGIGVPEQVEFKSIVPLLKGHGGSGYEAIFGSYVNYQRMVRTRDYKLILYPEAGEVQLFNMEEDPWETNNLFYKPEYGRVVSTLYGKLTRLQQEVGDTMVLSGMGIR